jgi:hypothetical protein
LVGIYRGHDAHASWKSAHDGEERRPIHYWIKLHPAHSELSEGRAAATN